jgi:hypothetical protein
VYFTVEVHGRVAQLHQAAILLHVRSGETALCRQVTTEVLKMPNIEHLESAGFTRVWSLQLQ